MRLPGPLPDRLTFMQSDVAAFGIANRVEKRTPVGKPSITAFGRGFPVELPGKEQAREKLLVSALKLRSRSGRVFELVLEARARNFFAVN
ncbi:hypothetical protein RRF57_010936 [Xylaria bambusicola]|uniref:Uncharacterized protein n=1 Tax=Xylaria bambusicola TaxID=326684 RepID=A0AAN7V430_9PEZI